MSLDGKIRRVQAYPQIADLEEISRNCHPQLNVRIAEIRLVEDLLDKIDVAVAACDYASALRLVEECVAAYASVKSTSREEALKNIGLAEIVSKLKENSTHE